MPPKFRLFAGPNGSGKTHLFQYLKTKSYIHTEIYVNADRIERDIKKTRKFNFNAYRVQVSEQEFKKHIGQSGLFKKMNDSLFLEKLNFRKGILYLNIPTKEITSYHASFIASYLALRLFKTGQSFCFETVMSHKSKIELLEIAKSKGYKTYLYFVFTNDVALNIVRVQLRVKAGEHNVSTDKITERYERSLKLLPLAVRKAEEAYVINNSEDFEVVAEKHKQVVTQKGTLPFKIKLKE